MLDIVIHVYNKIITRCVEVLDMLVVDTVLYRIIEYFYIFEYASITIFVNLKSFFLNPRKLENAMIT